MILDRKVEGNYFAAFFIYSLDWGVNKPQGALSAVGGQPGVTITLSRHFTQILEKEVTQLWQEEK